MVMSRKKDVLRWDDFARDARSRAEETSDLHRRAELLRSARAFDVLSTLNAPMPRANHRRRRLRKLATQN